MIEAGAKVVWAAFDEVIAWGRQLAEMWQFRFFWP
jgi:hypothetical protein